MLYQKVCLALFALLFTSYTQTVYCQSSGSVATFSLDKSATTSAGVYKTDGTLVRTLWSGVVKDAGTYQVKWDGTDDYLQPLPVDNYVIKVVSNNVQYNWQGTIGNNSASQLGPNIHRSLDPPNNIVITGNNAYYTVGYDEMTASHFEFALNAPKVKLDPFAGIGNQTTDYACTDGTNIYWTGWDNYQDTYSWVYATKVSDNSLVNFSAGVPYKVRYGKDFPSVIDFKSIQARPSGIAVSADYLFVSYKALGYISVLNKTTGAFVRTLNFTTPTAMAVDAGSIWICTGTNTLQKYPINSDGSLGTATISISNLSSPVDVRVNGNTLAVVDGGTSQQVKTFSTSTGSAGWVLGQSGGVLNSPIVSNDRFGFWRIEEITSVRQNQGGIAFASDGSFWIVDPSNRRMMHFDANRNFIEAILYQSKTYTCYVDPNNHARVMANLLEFEVNYSSPIQNSWTLKYNWEGSFKQEYHLADAVKDITTFSNGRTYGLVRRQNNIDNYEFVELLPSSGLRYTGVAPKGANALKIYPNGDVYDASYNGLGETQTWKKMTLTGFDGSNNPVYSALSTIVTNTSASGIKDPRLSGSKVLPWEVTSSNVLVCFRGNREEPLEENAYHLGGLNAATGKWIWKTSMGTRKDYQGEFPTDGAFDIGNGTHYQGSVAMAFERNIVWGFHGEGWKGSQVNKWNHYYDNGLFVGQFGFTGPEFNDDPIRAAGFAGNAFSPSIIKEGDEYYMYHNDESVHGGVHRWKITGLNTIKEQTIQISPSFTRSTEALDGIDLMAGLPGQGALSSNSQGWTRTPDVETNGWSAQANLLTYGLRKSPDLSVAYNPTSTGVNTINRDLGNNNLTNWGITGSVGYNMSEPNSPDGLGLNQYVDVLDNTGKIIVRFYQKINYSTGTTTVYANNTALITRGIGEMRVITKNFQPLDIDKVGSTMTVTYAGQSAVISDVFDPGANTSNPATLRLYFSNVGGALYEKFLRISNFRFIPFNTTITPAAPTVTADFAAKTLVASHQLGNSEILVSENNGEYVPYTGPITVGNVARPVGYWQFKIKAAADRNVSAIAKSPEFVESYECSATGSIFHEIWYNVNGGNISSFDWSKKPDNITPLAALEAPVNMGDNFAARIRGFVCPPQTGTYTFWVAGDDATELWLSTDANPANKSKIAFSAVATGIRDWNLYGSQKSVQVFLKAGGKYYIEALLKEESGQDHLSVAWQMPNGTMEAPISGSRLSPFTNSLNATTAVTQQCSATGTISHEVWNNVNGSGVASNNWSTKPNNTSPLSVFEAPKNIGDNYAARIRGYLCPPQSGNYTFWIAGDDATELWLSTDADPANKIKIAYNAVATTPRDWNLYSSQKSFKIYLQAGNKYFIEALHKEDAGEDNFAVAWQLPDGVMEAPIPGSRLSPFTTTTTDLNVTTTAATQQCSATGTILHEVWNNVNGSGVASNNWSNKPNNTSPLTLFESPKNIGDNFAARIRGYICPPQSGNYTFWIAGDDATELWLSTDADPANKIKIAYSAIATTSRDWNLYSSQKSFQIYLQAGNKYYIEALHKEDYGQDDFAVAWQLPDGVMEAPIPGSRLSPFTSDLNATAAVTQQCSATGSILREVWSNVAGSNIASNNWSNTPNNTSFLNVFEAPKNIGDNYATRVRGYLCPPQSGNYTFWISGDDATELWLSGDADPSNKSRIAFNAFYTGERNWDRYSTQKSFQIYLVAGNKYYIEALHKEGSGDDHLSVAWLLPDGTMEAPIPGSRLSPFNIDIYTTLNANTKVGSAVQGTETIQLANGNSTVLNNENLIKWNIYPNPIIGSSISIQSNSVPKGDYNILLVDALGQTIFKKSIIHNGGTFSHSISLPSKLSQGSYLLKVSGKNMSFAKKLLK